jgi:hypothetical protein
VGLEGNTTYDYRFIAENTAHEKTEATATFHTLPGLAPMVEGESAGAVTQTTASLTAQVDTGSEATTCEVQYVDESEFDAAGYATPTTVGCEPRELAEGAGVAPQGVSANLTGLQRGTTYHYRVLASDTTGPTEGADKTFTTLTTTTVTGGASAIRQSSANVTGTLNPEDVETYYYYQYGPTTEYGQSTSPEGPGINVGTGTSAVQAPATLVPLTPGVSYHYRLVAWNEDGTTYGQDETFTTEAGLAPLASTGPASGISVSEATISGTIDPAGKETSYRFEYGTNTEYGTQAFGTVLPEQGEQTVTLSLRGLEAGTTYHYRLVVSNPGGEATGADATFTTPPIADPLVNPAIAPLIATPAIAFPTGSQENTGATKTTTKKLTNAQKLAKALRACAKQPKRKRATCEKQAHNRYGTAKKKQKK